MLLPEKVSLLHCSRSSIWQMLILLYLSTVYLQFAGILEGRVGESVSEPISPRQPPEAPGDKAKLQEAKTTEYKFLSAEYIGKVPYFIQGNKVSFLTLSEPMNCIIIEDKEIAETYRKQFLVFWKMAK